MIKIINPISFSCFLYTVLLMLSSFSTNTTPSNYTEVSSTLLSSYKDGNVKVFKLQENSSDIGHAIWMNRSSKQIKATYFSEGDVYGKYNDWKKNKSVVLTCSGAFSDDLSKDNGALPVGLNVESGYIKNRTVVKKGMDGLVIVQATGGIVVSDLTKGDLYLKSLGKKVDVRKDFTAKYDLLKWAEKEKATIFQTQLLAYSNELKITTKGRVGKRERRFLALATTKKGILYHIIFNLPKPVYLYDGAHKILEHLKEEGMKVTAILNLDTGAYNVLQLNTGDSTTDRAIKGGTSISHAVNLLCYRYD